MLNPANIFRSRRTTLSLHVDPTGELIVNAPEKMSDRKIFDFVASRADWIRARQDAVLKNSFINQSVASYNTFYFLGAELTPVVSSAARYIERTQNALLIPAKWAQDEKLQKKIEKYFREMAKNVVGERAAYFSQVLKLKYAAADVNNNKTRWGSCSRGGEIAVNWRAVMLKPVLLDYIVVHEFCHLLEFNHTKNFWAVVETILPNWRKLRLELKRMAWILQLFR